MKLKVNIHLILLAGVFFIVSCGKDDTPVKPIDNTVDFSKCVIPGSGEKFEIVSLNLKEYPLVKDTTVLYVSTLLKQMDADVVALQEISSAAKLQLLADAMPGWKALFSPVSSRGMSLAFLYKTNEIELKTDETEALYADDSYSFPRPPLKIKVTHVPSGETVYLINNHFKCCSGEVNEARRRSAVNKLKSYIDTNLPDDMVVVMGDLNDRIDEDETENVFWEFISDTQNYRFADMPIATGSSAYWSYPSWPSHIDHLLITNECFYLVDTVFTVRPDICEPKYFSMASDHRPVELVLF